MNPAVTFKNTVQLVVRSGDTGEELFRHEDHNAISDDMLANAQNIYLYGEIGLLPACFLLKDGPAWSGFTWDPRNPWAPYCATVNNLYGGSFDVTADPHWKLQLSAAATWVPAELRHKLFYTWTKLADDLSVRALGLTGWGWGEVTGGTVSLGLATSQATVFVPQSLIILPTPVLVRGRKAGTQIPDILEVSYYLSAVGVN